MRYGMMSNFRRSWSEVGVRASLDQQQLFVDAYLFSAVNPITGDRFNLIGLTDMDTNSQFLFLTELKKQHPNEHVVVVWDNAPCHRPIKLHTIPGLTLISLPSYSPELNPAERYFEEIRRDTCNQVYTGLDAIEDTITQSIRSWGSDKEQIKALCGYDWIVEAFGEFI